MIYLIQVLLAFLMIFSILYAIGSIAFFVIGEKHSFTEVFNVLFPDIEEK